LTHSSDDSGRQQSCFPEVAIDDQRVPEQEVPALNIQPEQPIIGPYPDNWQQNVVWSTDQESTIIGTFLDNAPNASGPLPDDIGVTNDSFPVNLSNQFPDLGSELLAQYDNNGTFPNHFDQSYDWTTLPQQFSLDNTPPNSATTNTVVFSTESAYPQSTFNDLAPNNPMNAIGFEQPESSRCKVSPKPNLQLYLHLDRSNHWTPAVHSIRASYPDTEHNLPSNFLPCTRAIANSS
jgi:hypothetical protein